MVEKKQMVVLFKRIKIDEFNDEFVPESIIEGDFNEEDYHFLDTRERTYHHIAEPLTSGICFGYRFDYDDLGPNKTEESIKETKKEMLEYVKKFKYFRNIKENDYIYYIEKNDKIGKNKLFEDEDTDRIYEYLSEEEELAEDDCQFKDKKLKSFTPKEIYDEVRKTIKGQDEAIKQITTILWMNKNRESNNKINMLLIGPTGVGKTAICRKISKILDIPLYVYPTSGLSSAGYVGRSTDEILEGLYLACGKNKKLAENSIVVLDELDKLAPRGIEASGVNTDEVQNELLKMIEGEKMMIKVGELGESVVIDTSKIIFIGCGAFSELYAKPTKSVGFGDRTTEEKRKKIDDEKLIEYGLKSELVGRLHVKIELNKMTKKIMLEILLDGDESELLFTIDDLEKRGIKITNLELVIDEIINKSHKKDTGARGIVSTVTESFVEIYYEIANNPDKYSEIIIGENFINNPTDYTLIKKEVKTRKKVKG